jgi:hypothetical protein
MRDIRIYLKDMLSIIGQYFGLDSWSTSEVMAQRVEQSCGLFIFAAIVATFIEDKNTSDPIHQVMIIMSNTYISSIFSLLSFRCAVPHRAS